MGQITKTVKEINVRIPRGNKLELSARARFVWGRLVRLPFPASAAKLTGWCGGLVGRSDGLVVALAELAKENLVEHGPRGWVALPPCGKVEKKFEWPKRLAHLSRWQDRYGYTPVTVPVSYPFKGKMENIVTPQNALEFWIVWETLRGKPREDLPGPSLMEYRLGITRHTARKLTTAITSLAGVFDEDGNVRPLNTERQTHAVDTDPVERVLDEVGVPSESRQRLRDKADEQKLTNTKFIKLIKKAVGKHDSDEYGDDPTAMILSFLKAQAGFKVSGRGTSLRKPAGV